MTFRKVDPEEEIRKAIKKRPELKALIEEADKEYEDIKSGKLNKKFGD